MMNAQQQAIEEQSARSDLPIPPIHCKMLTVATALAVTRRQAERKNPPPKPDDSGSDIPRQQTDDVCVAIAKQLAEESSNGYDAKFVAKVVLSGLFWISVENIALMTQMAQQLVQYSDVIIQDQSFWVEFRNKLRRAIAANDDNRMRTAIASSLAIIRAVDLSDTTFNSKLSLLKCIIVHAASEFSESLNNARNQLTASISFVLVEGLTQMCGVLKEGIHISMKVCQRIDNSQSTTRSLTQRVFHEWTLDLLAQLLVHSTTIASLSSAIHCLAEDVESDICDHCC